MKKVYFLPLLFIIFLSGCASKPPVDRSIIQTSSPIFINSYPEHKIAFVNMKNSSNVDLNLTDALEKKLSKNGFDIVKNKEFANIIIKGNINYFRRATIKDPNIFFDFGVGFGFGRHFGLGVGHRFPLGYDYYDDYRTNSYIYDAQVGLQIQIKNVGKTDTYTTNLNFQSDRNVYSVSTITDIFNEKVGDYILDLFKN